MDWFFKTFSFFSLLLPRLFSPYDYTSSNLCLRSFPITDNIAVIILLVGGEPLLNSALILH